MGQVVGCPKTRVAIHHFEVEYRRHFASSHLLEKQVAKNDSILIDGIIAQRVSEAVPSADKGEAFEYFSFEQILKNYDLSEEEFDVGSMAVMNEELTAFTFS